MNYTNFPSHIFNYFSIIFHPTTYKTAFFVGRRSSTIQNQQKTYFLQRPTNLQDFLHIYELKHTHINILNINSYNIIILKSKIDL